MIARGLQRLALAAGLAAVAACHPVLSAETPAPPGRSARLDAVDGFWSVQSYRLELSQGVAVAVSCSYGGPCEKLTAASDNAAIAEVRAAALQTLRPVALSTNQQPAAVVVIVGKAPGTTTIRLYSHDGNREIAVTVVPPPGAPSASLASSPAVAAATTPPAS
jgi:hypothetical protein